MSKTVISVTLFALFIILVISARQISVRAQANPQQDERGLGLKTDSDKRTTKENNAQTVNKPELVLQTAQPNIFTLAFSPDGRLVASTGTVGTSVKLWDPKTGLQLRTLSGPAKGINSIAFSPDGRWLASGSTDDMVKVWDVLSGQDVRTLFAHAPGTGNSDFNAVRAVAFRPQSNMVAGLSQDTIKVWDVVTGREVYALPGYFMGLAFSRDGRELAAVNVQTYDVIVWDMASGREARKIDLPDDPMELMTREIKKTAKNVNKSGGSFNPAAISAALKTEIAYASDGRLLVYMSAGNQAPNSINNSLIIWEVNARRKSQVISGLSPAAQNIALSPDARWLASVGGDFYGLQTSQPVVLWDASTGTKMQTLAGHTSIVYALAFSPDGRTLASADAAGVINLWDVTTGHELLSMTGISNPLGLVAFTRDGKKLVSGGKTIWDIATGRGLRTVSLPDSKDPTEFKTISSDGRTLAVASSVVKLFDVATGRELHTLGQPDPRIRPLPVFSPDAKVLVTLYLPSAEQTRASILEITQSQSDAQKERQQVMQDARKGGGGSVLGSIIGLPTKAAIKQEDINQKLEDIEKRQQKRFEASLLPDAIKQLKFWDVATGRELRTIPLSEVGGLVAFSSDGRLIAQGMTIRNKAGRNATSAPGQQQDELETTAVKIWDVTTGQETRTIISKSSSVERLAFSPDGRTLAAAMTETDYSGGGSRSRVLLKFYEVETGRELQTIEADTGLGISVVLAFSPDGRMLATGSFSGEIKLWDVATKQLKSTLAGHESNIMSIDFSPDGRTLASSSGDSSTRLWDAKTGRFLATLISLRDGSDWLVATPEGLFDGSPGAWNQILWRFSQNTFDVMPVEAFFNEFYSPGLLTDVLSGKELKTPQDITKKDRHQPALQITLAKPEAPPAGGLTTRDITLRIKIGDAISGARDVRLFRNGSLVKVWLGDVLKGQVDTTLETTIPVVAGENRLTAYAFNRDNVKSRDATLTLTGAASLKRAGTVYILAVGINSYENPQYDLKYAVADAQDFADEVQRQQMKLGSFGSVEVVPLLDREATKANILTAIKRLAGQDGQAPLPVGAATSLAQLKPTQPEDAVVIFFAGHGTAQRQRFYLIPHDLGYNGSRTNLDDAGLQAVLTHSISDEEIERALEGVDAAQMLLVIDACNSGQALEAEEKRRGPMNSKGLAQLAYEKGMYILTAAQSFQAAQEVAQVGHGLLTYALVEEGLKQAAADNEPKDGTVLAREWLDYATARVPQMQVEKLAQAASAGRSLSFTDDDRGLDVARRNQQQPRVFYRRELEVRPLVIARAN